MKNVLIIYTLFFILSSMKCNKGGNVAGRYDLEFVKLEVTINDSSETIKLGDTLKFTLRIPDTLFGNTNKTIVKSVEKGFYTATLTKLDTVSKTVSRIRGNAINVNPGSSDEWGGVYVTISGKPNISSLNIIPLLKGLYCLQVTPQPGSLFVNKEYDMGLRVNFAIQDKHWTLYRRFKPDGYSSFLATAQSDNFNGYGWYYFRVE